MEQILELIIEIRDKELYKDIKLEISSKGLSCYSKSCFPYYILGDFWRIFKEKLDQIANESQNEVDTNEERK